MLLLFLLFFCIVFLTSRTKFARCGGRGNHAEQQITDLIFFMFAPGPRAASCCVRQPSDTPGNPRHCVRKRIRLCKQAQHERLRLSLSKMINVPLQASLHVTSIISLSERCSFAELSFAKSKSYTISPRIALRAKAALGPGAASCEY